MDDPTRPWLLEIEDPDAWLADVRSWMDEQEAKYGKDWERTAPPDQRSYTRSRGITQCAPPPPYPPEWMKMPE